MEMKRNINVTIRGYYWSTNAHVYSEVFHLFVGVQLWFRQLYKLLHALTNVIDSSVIKLTVYLVCEV